MRSYSSLSDHDFELFVADLFGTIDGCRYEAYARGPDLGEDLRRERHDGGVDAIQCKHYLHSSVAALRAAGRAEARKLAKVVPQPTTYRFVTSRRLTRGNKHSLLKDLSPYLKHERDVWGEDDLEIAITQHPDVERRHIKLWLPSSPQLQAALNAGTYARSAALVAQILETMQRWVPTKAFFEARKMLRNEHVCVIAGIPGIGKTTLAKMLLADAIDDRYEPIQISADVEEAWDVFQPRSKQVFYYDDFLGRTALTERLGKNEEDRLLAFMRRAIGSKTTLFILTTREYILQQARQLYEQLSLEGLDDHRILLTLEHYSRLDRARVFCNHAFLSGQLSSKARRDLVTNRAYEKIIDHPAYSPRQIEWVTGLSGHRLTDADNEEFVPFALAALNNPGRIWRYAFEHQLTDGQRAVLLALASMPDQVAYEDLLRAFERFASFAGIESRGRAFDRALEVLDDSFVRSFREDGTIFVSVYNPAVGDFLGSYLSESPGDATAAVRGAVFFEQVETLGRILRAPEIPPAFLATEFVSALGRCFAEPSCSWQRVYYGREATSARAVRRGADLDSRANFIGRVRGWGPPYSSDPLQAEIVRIYREALGSVAGAWRGGVGASDRAVTVLLDLRNRGESTHALLDAAKDLVKSHLFYPEAFEQVLRLRERVPEAYDDDEWEELGQKYSRVAEEALSDWRELRDEDEVDSIERLATEMDVEVDSQKIADVRQRVIDRNAEAADNAGEDRDEVEPVTERPDADTSAAIDALFARLAED